MADAEMIDCPFCGSDEITVEQAKKGWYSAFCGNCEAEGPPSYSNKDARLAWNGRPAPPSPSIAPMCERKTAKLEEEGYTKTGYVLRQPGKDREVVVSDGGAVSWFTTEQWNWLMFNRDHVEFQWPKPITDLASRPAEVDDWISVEDRLPKNGTCQILIWGGPDHEDPEEAYYSDGFWTIRGEDRRIHSDGPDTPTHWMPMPAAPKLSTNQEK